jgi:hypothetical protein
LIKEDLELLTREYNEPNKPEYYFMDGEGALIEATTADRISFLLEENSWYACRTFGQWEFDNIFVPHISAEESIRSLGGWDEAIKAEPYEVVELLRVLSRRGTYRGKCPVCMDW